MKKQFITDNSSNFLKNVRERPMAVVAVVVHNAKDSVTLLVKYIVHSSFDCKFT